MLPVVELGRHCCSLATNLENYRPIVGDEMTDEIRDLARRTCPLRDTLPVVNRWVIETADFAWSRKRTEADCVGCHMFLGQRLSLTPIVNIAKSRSSSFQTDRKQPFRQARLSSS